MKNSKRSSIYGARRQGRREEAWHRIVIVAKRINGYTPVARQRSRIPLVIPERSIGVGWWHRKQAFPSPFFLSLSLCPPIALRGRRDRGDRRRTDRFDRGVNETRTATTTQHVHSPIREERRRRRKGEEEENEEGGGWLAKGVHGISIARRNNWVQSGRLPYVTSAPFKPRRGEMLHLSLASLSPHPPGRAARRAGKKITSTLSRKREQKNGERLLASECTRRRRRRRAASMEELAAEDEEEEEETEEEEVGRWFEGEREKVGWFCCGGNRSKRPGRWHRSDQKRWTKATRRTHAGARNKSNETGAKQLTSWRTGRVITVSMPSGADVLRILRGYDLFLSSPPFLLSHPFFSRVVSAPALTRLHSHPFFEPLFRSLDGFPDP